MNLNQHTKVIILTLCSAFTFLGFNELQSKLPITNHGDNSNSVLAQTADERKANQVFEKANCAVVTIKSGGGHGSGFLVNSDGLIITNAHVLDDGPNVVTVVLYDGTKVSGDVMGFAYNGVDLAAVKIPKQPNLCKLSLGDSSSIKVGYDVFAIGTPLDPEKYPNTLTIGTISKINNDTNRIQHTALIKLRFRTSKKYNYMKRKSQ